MTVVGVLGAFAFFSGVGYLWVGYQARGSELQETADLVTGAGLVVLGAWACMLALLP